MLKKLFASLFGLVFGLLLFVAGVVSIMVMDIYPELPELKEITNYQPRMPLEIYTSDGVLIGRYGEERREFTRIDKFPEHLKQAVLAAEDKRFYEHWGVDVIGVARAVIGNVRAGHVQSGASTITQQVARNFYLTNEKSYRRKFEEALLAYKIEQSLSKDEILELYFNHIYLGQRAYGFAAAAKIYFNKNVQDLTVAESAMLAGLPKAPSAYNPMTNRPRAQQRQHYVLNNMAELGYITPEVRDAAKNEELAYVSIHDAKPINQDALYVAEMARQEMFERYGESIYTQGLRVYTTVHSAHQKVATQALRSALRQRTSGTYRGAEAQLDWDEVGKLEEEEQAEAIAHFLSGFYTVEDLQAAVVTSIHKNKIEAVLLSGEVVAIHRSTKNAWDAFVNNGSKGDLAIRLGSLVRVRANNQGQWHIAQIPELQGALIALDPRTGAIRAMVGGYDFHSKAFNRATQAQRQPGSLFKPFVYSAALAGGMTATTSLNDAPLSSGNHEFRNADGRFRGEIPLNQALIWSRNLPAVRVVSSLGINATRNYVQRFGFAAEQVPVGLSMALGSGSTTPLQMAEAYAIFANGGYRVASHIIDRVVYVDKDGNDGDLRTHFKPFEAGKTQEDNDSSPATLVIDPRNAYIMTTMLQDVVRKGTGQGAKISGHHVAGKTGTTNDAKDVWFAGYSPTMLAVVYLGYDQPRPMGRNAFGGTWAVPVWKEYMQFALKGVNVRAFPKPNGVVARNNTYFFSERTETDPDLAVDNRSSAPVVVPEKDELGDFIRDISGGNAADKPPVPAD